MNKKKNQDQQQVKEIAPVEDKRSNSKEEIKGEIKKKFWDVYNNNTRRLSSICRQLAFAEGGICWFYIKSFSFSIEIKLILTFLLLFFIADACQYFLLAMNNKKQAEFYEDLLINDFIKTKEQVIRPTRINSSANLCFSLKLLFISIASLLLITQLYCH